MRLFSEPLNSATSMLSVCCWRPRLRQMASKPVAQRHSALPHGKGTQMLFAACWPQELIATGVLGCQSVR